MITISKDQTLTAEEAARILKVSKYTLYELIKRGEIPAQKIGRQLRIDPAALEQSLTGLSPKSLSETTVNEFRPNSLRFLGSHDPVLELLADFLKHSASPVELQPVFSGSMAGLIALFQGRADLAGVHLWDDKTEQYNKPFVEYVLPGEKVYLTNLMQRIQGWIVPRGNPMQLKDWSDLARNDLRFVNRQKGSGTRLRIDSWLRNAQVSPGSIQGYELEEETHSGVACRVANGQANAGIGVQAAALRMGLDFIPLFSEKYDLVCLEKTYLSPAYQQLISVLNSPAFKEAVQSTPGYDTSLTGQLI
ncbi:MAG TPA: substrate-binding domain-containing protein [Verrucomicrobiae bacterium]|nr:substrate-binding domain-containing protein [Verrucomicrobiae bacterium]